MEQGSKSVLQWNKHPTTLLIQMHNKKKDNIQFCTVSSRTDFIQYKFDH